MRVCVLLGFGTWGKMVVKLVHHLLALFGRQPIAAVAFDSNRHDALAGFVLPLSDPGQIDVALDGQDLRGALQRGEFPGLQGLDPDLLKATRAESGFSLSPPIGRAAAMIGKNRLFATLNQLVQSATSVLSPHEGEIVVIRCFASFGGTSRGLVWESSEALLDLAAQAGLRLHVLDLVGIPGLATATSKFNARYLRNTWAFVKEAAAFRSEAFHRVLWDDRGRPHGERSRAFPSTLALVSDTNDSVNAYPLHVQAGLVARLVELFTRPAFAGAFWETHVDMQRHDTAGPVASRVGLHSLIVTAREETIARHHHGVSQALDEMIEPGSAVEERAADLLRRLDFSSPDASTLRVLGTIRERLAGRLGHDPVDTLGALHADRAGDYHDEYDDMLGELRAIEADALASEVADELAKAPAIGEELTRLRSAILPGQLLATLRRVVAILDGERAELAAGLADQEQERIEEEERAAGSAREAWDGLRRRWWTRAFGLGAGRVRDALEQVKEHLQAALSRRIEFLRLRAFVLVLDRIVADLRTGAHPAWATALDQTEALVGALQTLRIEVEGLRALAERGSCTARGPVTATPVPPSPEAAAVDHAAHVERARPLLAALYGASPDAVRHELMAVFLSPLTGALRAPCATLAADGLSENDLRDLVTKAAPLSPVDVTRGAGIRARLVATGGAMGALHAAAARAWTGAAEVARERWVDLGPELGDELTVVTIEEGVPISSFKAVQEARAAYLAALTPEDSHLDPLFVLLPDPAGYLRDAVAEQRLVLLGLATGVLRRSRNRFLHVGEDGTERIFDPASYDMAVAITSRFVASVRLRGVQAAVRELQAQAPGRAWSPVLRQLRSDVERLASRHRPAAPRSRDKVG